MKTLVVTILLTVLAAAPAGAGDADFHAIVRGVESGYGVHRMRIPLFGVARFVVHVARPEGVKDFDMAVFETEGRAPLDGSRFDHIMRHSGGGLWTPAIRVRSRVNRQWTYLYVRQEGRDWRMLIATFEPDDAVIMQAKVDLDFLARALNDPENAGHVLDNNHREP